MSKQLTLDEMLTTLQGWMSQPAGGALWDVITGLRGPDSPSERPNMTSDESSRAYDLRRARKRDTVEVIRGKAMNGRCGGAARFRTDLDYVTLPPEDEWEHFDKHVARAARALGLRVVIREKPVEKGVKCEWGKAEPVKKPEPLKTLKTPYSMKMPYSSLLTAWKNAIKAGDEAVEHFKGVMSSGYPSFNAEGWLVQEGLVEAPKPTTISWDFETLADPSWYWKKAEGYPSSVTVNTIIKTIGALTTLEGVAQIKQMMAEQYPSWPQSGKWVDNWVKQNTLLSKHYAAGQNEKEKVAYSYGPPMMINKLSYEKYMAQLDKLAQITPKAAITLTGIEAPTYEADQTDPL